MTQSSHCHNLTKLMDRGLGRFAEVGVWDNSMNESEIVDLCKHGADTYGRISNNQRMMPVKLREICIVVAKGKDTADFAGIDVSKHLELVLDSVDQGQSVQTLSLADTNLNHNLLVNELLPWLKSSKSVDVLDISNNSFMVNMKTKEKDEVESKLLKEFGIELPPNASPYYRPGSAADQGKQIKAENTNLTPETQKLLLNDDEHGLKAREEKEKSAAASKKKINAYNEATEQLQELWSGLTDELMTKLTTSLTDAGIKSTPPVIFLNEIPEEMKSKV